MLELTSVIIRIIPTFVRGGIQKDQAHDINVPKTIDSSLEGRCVL